MTPLAISWSCALALVLAPVRVQQDDAIEKIEVRVTTTTPGSVIVDRGSTDGLMRGDRVVLTPKEGATYEGFIDEPLERIARVELADSGASVAAGTRGDVLIPKARLNRRKATTEPATPPTDKTGDKPGDKPATPVKKKRSATTKAPNVPGADAAPPPTDGAKKSADPAKKSAEPAKKAASGAATAADGAKTVDGAKTAAGTKPAADGSTAPKSPTKKADSKSGDTTKSGTGAPAKADPKSGDASKSRTAAPAAATGADPSAAKSTGAKPAASSGTTGSSAATTKTTSKNVKAPTAGDGKPPVPPSGTPIVPPSLPPNGKPTVAPSGDASKTAKPAATSKSEPSSGKPPVAAVKKPATKSTQGTQSAPAGSKAGAKPAASGAAKSGQATGKTATTTEHSPWKTQDEGFTKDKPLLSLLKPLRPEQRATRLTGSVWAAVNLSDFDEGKGSNSYARAGTVLDLENPFSEGGALHLDTEVNYRDEVNGGTGTDLLTRRLSYSRGGTRFEPSRWEFGRFLQYGMPEFEWLDGVEWQQRTEGGDRFGASAGFMPEPDDDFQSFQDFQVAAYYLWANDESERFTLGAGVQQTWHDSGVDRDLLVAKARYVPGDGWDFHCANWVDYYGAGDNVKDVDFALTQAVWSLSRHYQSDSWWDLTYRKVSFPDIDREGEFTPWTKSEIDHNRLHRLMLSGSNWWSKSTRLHGRVGGWVDEDETGGTAEAGMEFDGPFLENARLDFTGFGTLGEFTSLVGGRVSYGAFVDNGRWDLFYEIENNHEDGFVTDIQDIPQHRLYATRTFYFPSGWTMSATAGALFLDGEFGWNVGFFAQKSF